MSQQKIKRLNKEQSSSLLGAFNQSKTALCSGERGNMQTIKAIQKIAHEKKSSPLVRNFTKKILNKAGTKSQHYYDECKAIGKYIQQNFPYVRDPKGDEFIIDPELSIAQIDQGIARGDCEDMSLLIATCLLNIGATPYYTIVRYPSRNSGFQHIYVTCNEANLFQKKKPLVLDAIVKHKPIGYEVPFKLRKYIKV